MVSNMNSQFHARSNSLPSRPHPVLCQIDEQLCKLTAREATASSTSKMIHGLIELYDLVNNYLLLHQTQATLRQEGQEKQGDEVLNQSLKLMDVCVSARDSLSELKEETQELQSVLRRRRGGESRLESEVGQYLKSKKIKIKMMQKSLKDFKTEIILSSVDHQEINILREVDAYTFQVFDSLLSYISKSKLQTKPTNWNLISKLMHSQRVSCEDAAEINEFEQADATLCHLIANKSRKTSTISADSIQQVLGKLETCIQDLEEALERLLRSLIKTRVTLLNILNH